MTVNLDNAVVDDAARNGGILRLNNCRHARQRRREVKFLFDFETGQFRRLPIDGHDVITLSFVWVMALLVRHIHMLTFSVHSISSKMPISRGSPIIP